MSQPPAYRPATSFEDSAGTQPPGVPLDVEFDNIATAISGIRRNLALIQRDDNALRNGVVGTDALNPQVLALISAGSFQISGQWDAGRSYARGDMVSDQGAAYAVMEPHTSSDLATDFAAGLLVKIFDVSQGERYRAEFTGNSVRVEFTLPNAVARLSDIEVFVDGVLIDSSEYTLAADKLTFASAPGAGAAIVVFSVVWAIAPPIAQFVAQAERAASGASQIFGSTAAGLAATNPGQVFHLLDANGNLPRYIHTEDDLAVLQKVLLTGESAADPAIGPRLWGYRLPITEALARHAQGKFDERISTFDFLPYAKHSQILDRINNDDLSDWLLDGIFSNPECRGARIFCPPGLYNHEQTLTCMQHLTLYGAAGREMMDNSANAGGDTGSRFRFRGNSGHGVVLTVPDLDNYRTIARLQDMLFQHNRLLDNGLENPGQVDGCALYIAGGLGPTQGDRQLRFILDNVGLYGGIDDNLLIEGNTYGSEIRYIHSMRAGRNGIRSLYGPLAGESRISMARVFQCGWNGTTDIDRAGTAISAALVEIDKLSTSESRGPNLMIGGIANIGSLQCESGGLDVTAADRKQVVLGWLDNGLLSLNVNNMLLDPGNAYQGAVVYHSRHASNVRLKGHFANALGVGGRHVELQAPDGPYSCGEIDVRETNATVFLDNSQRYCIKSGIEVRLRHGAHVALTGDNELVNFRPDELYDPKGCWDAATWRFTAPHNLILDPEMVMAMTGVDKANHDRLWVHVQLNGADYRIIPDDPSSHVLAGSSLATFPVAMPTIPMDQGDYVEFKYKSYGGPPTVGLVANESYLKLTALP